MFSSECLMYLQLKYRIKMNFNSESTIIQELPRDILTAFFLLKLPRDDSRCRMAVGEKAPPYWEDFSCMGRFYLWCAVLLPYAIQFFVLGALGKEIPQLWEEFDVPILQDLWWNTTAFSVLFVYMFKDLVSFYSSV